MPRYSNIAGKVLGLLAGGAMLGFTKNKQQRLELIKDADYNWNSFDQKELKSILRSLKLSKYIQFENNHITLTDRGKARRLLYIMKELEIKKPRKWDRKWRLVLFDIEESRKKIRDALRRKLKDIGFLEFQKSVFVFPFACRDEINFIINYFGISDFVYYIEAPISPDDFLRKHFKLN